MLWVCPYTDCMKNLKNGNVGKEIERKFLVHYEKWTQLEKSCGNQLHQGYILSKTDKTIRVRTTNDKGFITIKGATFGASRSEFEYEIPKDEAIELLNQFAETSLFKTRYEIAFENKIWEVDIFHGDNEGLIVAEIELDEENEPFNLPEWIAEEVTNDSRYYNSNLSKIPFSSWYS